RYAGNVTISNCNIRYSATNGIYVRDGASPNINNCSVSNNNGDGIYLYSNSFPQIINNLGNGIRNSGNCNPSLGSDITQWNDIYGNGSYNFYNNTNIDINAQYVYWGTIDPAQIAAMIYDKFDNGSLGIVYFNPWTNAAHNALFTVTGYYVGLKQYLEGPFNGTDMNTDLNPDAASATSGTMLAQQAAFLKNDGSIVGMDGSLIPLFNSTITQQLFVVTWHRNHLGIMSANPLVESGGIYNYDFTSSAGQVFGGTLACKELAPGIWGMVGGDGNANGQVNNSDKNDVWAPQAGTSGYMAGDFNLDSQVNNLDKNDLWIPNSGTGSQVPN
ncbi:MAG: right-handed parallel beta-helix repeat-containing protein, partial [Bacteroidales bacterium]|nr:right-handed parallel beta-helix repeat-containing protein [Bacteroidales bacterium]